MMTEINEWEKAFLVLERKEGLDEFALQMLQENKITGLLAMEKRVFNGEEKLYYDISGKQPLSPNVADRSLSGQDIRMLMQSLYCLIAELHSYFLDIKGVILHFENIYKAEEEYLFCYEPSLKNCETEQKLSAFAESLLGYTDHDDEEAVFLSYEFYCRVREGKSLTQCLEEVLSLSQEKETEEIFLSGDAERIDCMVDDFREEENCKKDFSFDIATFVSFALLFLVSLGYLLFINYSQESIKFSETISTKNGWIALVFLVLSFVGMFAEAVHHIDIRGKK